MTIDLGAGRHLILAGGGRSALWIAAGAVALGLLLVLYRYERHLVSRRVGRSLLVLRLIAATALVAALFEPIAAKTFRESVRGRVVLGVDLSESMATTDPIASARESSPAEPPLSISRREVARKLLSGDWLQRIGDDHNVESLGFAREAVSGTPSSLAEALKTPAKVGDPAALVTDWSPALERALTGGGSAPTLGVILLTDGRQNAPGDPGRIAERLASRGVPVYPVLIGSTTAPKDVAIAAVKAPDAVYKGDVASVEVVVKVDGIPGVEVPVILERPGSPPMRQVVRGQTDGSRPVVTFRVPMETVGPQEMTLGVAPLIGDSRPENDRRTVTVQVADDKARVLLIDGEARWEFRYLRNALARDPRVAVESVVFGQPKTGPGELAYRDKLPARPEGKAADPLGAFDAIIVGDVGPDVLPADDWVRLERYVGERGGTLVVCPGPRGWSGLVAIEPARKLLPVVAPQPATFDPAVDPAHPSLPPGVSIGPAATADLGAWPMLQLAADSVASRAVWEGLPRLPWALVGKAKPGANVLATVGGTHDGAVIAAQRYGLGKVLWVGTDATWRWRYRVGDAYHHRFWGQVIRWAASGKLAGGNLLVRFGPEQNRNPAGEGIRLTAKLAESLPDLGVEALMVARLFRVKAQVGSQARVAEGDALAVVPLRPVPGQFRAFAATAPALPPGTYLARLDAPRLAEALQAAGVEAPEASVEVVPPITSELVELAAARDPLERLAATTGGRVFTAAEADQLPPLLRGRTVIKTRTEEANLWDTPWALGLFFTVLTAEWVLRKRSGLP